jgi:hypothetical protein
VQFLGGRNAGESGGAPRPSSGGDPDSPPPPSDDIPF